MTPRTARLWAVLAALGVVIAATLAGTVTATVLAGVVLIGTSLFLVALDGLRKRGRTRR